MFLSGSRLFPPHLFFHHCRFMLSETILITCIYIHLRLIGFCYKTLTGFIYIKNIYFKLERVSASRSRIMLMCQQNKAVTSLLLCPHMFLIHDLTFYCQYFSTVESFNLGVSGFKTGFSCLLLSPFTGRTLWNEDAHYRNGTTAYYITAAHIRKRSSTGGGCSCSLWAQLRRIWCSECSGKFCDTPSCDTLILLVAAVMLDLRYSIPLTKCKQETGC